MPENDTKAAVADKAAVPAKSGAKAKSAAAPTPVPAILAAPKPGAPKPIVEPAPVAIAAPVAATTPPQPAPSKPVPPVSKPAAKKPVAAAKAPVAEATKPTATSQPAVPMSVTAPAAKESIMDTVTNTTETLSNKAQAFFAGTTERTKGAVEKSQQMFSEANEFAKGNVEAMIESSKIAAKGAEDIARYSTDFARQTVAQANENARKFASVKSPTEFFQLQSEIARGAVDTLATETAKFTENYLKLMGEVVQPLSNRFAMAAEKVKTAA